MGVFFLSEQLCVFMITFNFSYMIAELYRNFDGLLANHISRTRIHCTWLFQVFFIIINCVLGMCSTIYVIIFHWNVSPRALANGYSDLIKHNMMCMLSPRHEYQSDASLYKALGPAKELTLWVSHPTTDLPQLYVNESFTIPCGERSHYMAATLLLALADDTLPTRPPCLPGLPLHHRRAILPQLRHHLALGPITQGGSTPVHTCTRNGTVHARANHETKSDLR
jgi:hypothetical protein